MEKTLTVGKTYTVTTASECSVTDSNGLVLCTAAAGEQKAFVATTPTIIFSDDSASVVAVFKGAPALGGSGGSGGGAGTPGTPAGFGTPTASATALEAGAAPTITVTASGANTAKVFDFAFGIPRGEKGADGAKGDKGDPGLTQQQIDLLSLYASAEGRNVPLNEDGTFSTTIGRTYTVESSTDEVLITNADGDPLCKLEPAGQIGFVANTTICQASTLNCNVTEVFRAAALIQLSGGGISVNGVPAGYIEAEFLEISGYSDVFTTSYVYPHFLVQTPGITTGDDWCVRTIHAVNFSTGKAQAEGINAPSFLMKCFYGGNAAKMFYGAYGTSSDVKTSNFGIDTKAHAFSMNYSNGRAYAGFDEKELTLADVSTELPEIMGVFVAYAISTSNATSYYPFNGKKYNWQFVKNGKIIRDLKPYISADGNPCMFDLINKETFNNKGTKHFVVGMTLPQARKLSALPDRESELTISLPAEIVDGEGNVTDSAVQTALDTAAAKGWTITIQTYTEA